jgi:hypothetical protein
MESILIQGCITLLGILITAILTYNFAKQRYTFEKFLDRKLNIIDEIYGKIISLENELKKYTLSTGADTGRSKELSQKKSEKICEIENKLNDLRNFFWSKEISLDEDSVFAIQSLIDIFMEMYGNLGASKISQDIGDSDTFFKQWHDTFQIMQNKLPKVKEQLRRDFRKQMK